MIKERLISQHKNIGKILKPLLWYSNVTSAHVTEDQENKEGLCNFVHISA